MVITITNETEFSDLISKSSQQMKLLVVDFFTTWCTPCQHFAPEFEKLSLIYTNDVYFAKVDCDLVASIPIKEKISRLPTLKGYLNTTNIFKIEGVLKMDVIIKEIETHIVMPCLRAFFSTKPNIKTQNYLLKLSNNIINNPHEGKYRQLRFSNKAVQENLIQQEGVMECLLTIGFDKEDQRLHMPNDRSIEDLRVFSKQLSVLSQEPQDKPNSSHMASANSNNIDKNVLMPSPPRVLITDNQLTNSEKEFFDRIKSIQTNIILYENEDLMNIVNVLADVDSYKSTEMSEEGILKKVLRWFKYDFFSWFSEPTCSSCSKRYESIGSAMPTADESRSLARHVELYQCRPCQSPIFRFPRYNHPEKLLESRTGRCGEWANCFSMIIRTFIREGLFSSGRFVMDWSDHVWCEIYLKLDHESERRWVHVDPCECSYNTPLVYKLGWNKRIDYVIGVTLVTGDVQDVTWRYTNDFKATLLNRNLVREDVLTEKLVQFHVVSKTNVSEIIKELASFLIDKKGDSKVSDSEMIGRTTGSMDWRQQRGELGRQESWEKQHVGQSITATALEIANNCVHIQYNCSTDSYYRPCDVDGGRQPMDGDVDPQRSSSSISSSTSSSSGTPGQRKASATRNRSDLLSRETDNWRSLAASWINIARKVEYDWQIVYLARTEGCPPSAPGQIRWTVDLAGSSKVIAEISIFASSAEFHSASVRWRLEEGALEVPVNGFVTTAAFDGCTRVSLTASLIGSPDCTNHLSWQHTQLCRQKSTDYEVRTLQIKVELRDR